MTTKKPLICGIGNMLMGDDGFAQHVLKFLEKENIDADVRDFGTAALSVANDLCDYDFVVFIDAISAGKPPGTVYEFEITMEEIEESEYKPLMHSFSFHDADFKSMLSFANKIGCLPEKIILIGCEPSSIKPSLKLTPEVNKAVKKVGNRVIEILKKY